MENNRDPRTYAIIGVAMEVHSQLGCGFLEAVYLEAMSIELVERQVPFQREVQLPIHYKRQQLDTKYRADLLCYDEVIVELKAVKELAGVHEAQVLNYLKATGKQIGLLINFGGSVLRYKRFIKT